MDAVDELAPGAAGLAARGLVRAVYQPVIALESGVVVGYEALARGPAGDELERPDALLSAARRAGMLEQVDWECRLAAVAGALDAQLDRSTTLFVNVEPEALDSVSDPARAPALWRRAEEQLSLAVELPASALRSHPAALVRAAAACRDRGWIVVLDDVGCDASSLSLLPLVVPDAIKLDVRAAREPTRPPLATVATAAWAEQERTGAAILAEGIESERQLEVAHGIGATLGQGWLWGLPGPLPAAPAAPCASGLHAEHRRAGSGGTPFEIVSAARPPREASVRRMAAMSRHLEHCAGGLGPGAIVLAAVQDARRLGATTQARYGALAVEAALVAVLGAGIAPEPAAGVHGADLPAGDPLLREWCLVILTPHFAVALAGRELGEDGPRSERRFRFVLTHERELVIAAARSLATRLVR